MRVLLQRVAQGRVSIADQVVGEIAQGLVLLVGFCAGDDAATLAYMKEKCLQLRIFSDENGKMNLSLLDVGGELLVISQFTLYGDCVKGRRPSFTDAAPPELANQLYEDFVALLRTSGVKVETGKFGADMMVEIFNDGPVTLMLERESNLRQ